MENRKRFGVRQDSVKRTQKFHKPTSKQNPNDFVFGVQSVLELLNSERDIEKILIQRDSSQQEIEQLAREKDIVVQRVPIEKINRITGKNHQGVIAFVSAINYARLSDLIASSFESGETPLFLILDRVTDVRNFGAIARTAEASGVNALVVPQKGAAQINSDALKTSSGALSHIPVCREADLIQAIEEFQESGFTIMACTEKATENYFDQDFSGPLAIVMGSEEDGISDHILRKCDLIGQIPMLGKVGSLNVSVASGIMLFEVLRQRSKS